MLPALPCLLGSLFIAEGATGEGGGPLADFTSAPEQ